MKRLVIALSAALLLGAGFAGTVSAKPFSGSIVLPGATSAEGIARGAGSTFYAGDLFTGDIFRGDVRAGAASLFIDAPGARNAAGMKFDRHDHLLFVAGLLFLVGFRRRLIGTITAFTLGNFLGVAIGPDVEPDDNRVRRRGEQDIGLVDCPDARVDDPRDSVTCGLHQCGAPVRARAYALRLRRTRRIPHCLRLCSPVKKHS